MTPLPAQAWRGYPDDSMRAVAIVGIGKTAFGAFLVSGAYYGLLGTQLVRLSSAYADPRPSPAQTAAVELVRNLVDNALDARLVARSPQVVQAYLQDPLVHRKISAGLAQWILTEGAKTLAQASAWTVPTLLLYAGSDRLVDAVIAYGTPEVIAARLPLPVWPRAAPVRFRHGGSGHALARWRWAPGAAAGQRRRQTTWRVACLPRSRCA